MNTRVEHYTQVVETLDFEWLTVFVVAGASCREVADALGTESTVMVDREPTWTEDHSAYCSLDVAGGTLAIERSRYADPPNSVLVGLSSGGRSAAVVRDNIQAHNRFGCARDGELLFDDDEYIYL